MISTTKSKKQPKASLFAFGETGTGKSSLGNTLLKENVFKVSDKTNSRSKLIGKFGKGDENDFFYIDTPGFMDMKGVGRENLC